MAKGLQDFCDLERFMLRGVRPTGKQLGKGSYGRVEELEINGQVCAGKRLYEVLLNAGVKDITRKYHEECQVTMHGIIDS